MTAPASCVYRSVHLRCRPLIVAIGTAGETACPTLLDQSFGEVGGAVGFACQWKLISIAIQSRKRLCTPQRRSALALQCGKMPSRIAGNKPSVQRPSQRISVAVKDGTGRP